MPDSDEGTRGTENGADASLDVDAFLVLVSGVRPGGTAFALSTRRGSIVGTAEDSDIRLPDPAMAPRHARIIHDNVGFAVEDLGAGTFVGGRRITRVYLEHGDRLRVGTTEFAFFYNDEPRGAHFRDDGSPEIIPPSRRLAAPLGALPRVGRAAEEHALPPRRDLDRDFSPYELARKLLVVKRFVAKNALILGAATTVGLAAGIASAFLMPPGPRAVCGLSLWPEREANAVGEQTPPRDPSTRFFFGAERAFVGKPLVRSTLEKLSYPNDERTLQSVGQQLRLENVGGNDFQASYTPGKSDPGREDPAAFLEAHVNNYLESEVTKRVKVLAAEVDFLRGQVKNLDGEMASVSADAVKFREEHVDKLPEQTPLTPSTRAQLETRRVELSGLVQRLEGQLGAVRKQLGRGAPLVQAKVRGQSDQMRALDQRLRELQAQGLAEGHPEVKRVQEQKRALEQQMTDQLNTEATSVERLSNAEYENLRSQADQLESSLRAARAELADVRGILGRFQKISRDMPAVGARLDDFSQTEGALKRLHGQLFDRLKKAELQLELERVSAASRYEIGDPAHVEKVGKKRLLLVRGLLGVLGGGALAMVVIGFFSLRRLMAQVAAPAGVLFVLALGLLVPACGAPEARFVWAHDLPPEPAPAPVIQPGDTISVEIQEQPTLSGEFPVREDGNYLQPTLGSIRVVGLAPAEAALSVTRALKKVLVDPKVMVWKVRSRPIRVAVVGEVRLPGNYELDRERSVLGALAAAGWLSDYADDESIYVVRKRSAQARIRFRLQDLKKAEPRTSEFVLHEGDLVIVE